MPRIKKIRYKDGGESWFGNTISIHDCKKLLEILEKYVRCLEKSETGFYVVARNGETEEIFCFNNKGMQVNIRKLN